ncbi:MAG TPA: hypothetical protein VHL59_14095 [Thermoanaerobaculia bacterium]|nr:hypothetical protein [Thermoanaerobaculia bacterium]
MTRPGGEGQLPRRPEARPAADGGTLPAGAATPVTTPPPAVAAPPSPEPPRESAAAVSQSLEERLAAATAAGGLTVLPPDFGDAQGDWTTVRAGDPFTILYLDYRQADRISPEMVSRHRELLQRFWQEKLRSMTQGAARFAILKKYGGPEESERLIRSYPEVIENARQQLITRGGIEQAHRAIVDERESIACRRIDEKLEDFLVDLVLQPEEIRSLLLFGEREGVPAAKVANRIHERFRGRGLVAETEPAGATLEARLLSTAWIHPSRRRTETITVAAAAPQRKQSLLVPVLLFSIVVVLVLLTAAALRSSRRVDVPVATVTASAPQVVSAETTFSSSQTESAVESRTETQAAPVEASVLPTAEPAATAPTEREPAPAIDTSGIERERLRGELASIEQDPDPRSALDRLTTLEQTLGSRYADERIAATKLRAGLERVLLLRQLEQEKQAAEARALAEREREWEQRIAAIEELMKQPNYSGAKTLADQLLAAPDVPPPIADRGRRLRDQAVDELQKIFSGATVKSRTGRAPRRQQ